MVTKNRYSIQELLQYRNVHWVHSYDFVYMTQVPAIFEPFWIKPDYYCCGIVHNGKMVLEDSSGNPEVAERGSFLLFRPTKPFRILEIDPNTNGAFLLFNRNFLISFSEDVFYLLQNSFLNTLGSSSTVLKDIDYIQLSTLFSQVFPLLDNISPQQWNYSAKGLVLMLLNETDGLLQPYKSRRFMASADEQKIISGFLHLSGLYFATNRDMAFYAERLNVSIGHLHHTIKKGLNTTPVNILNKTVLQEAKLLLGFPERNISEVAGLLSFSSVHSFSRFFKKHTGVAPSSYAKSGYQDMSLSDTKTSQ